jgi:hypothetical protein
MRIPVAAFAVLALSSVEPAYGQEPVRIVSWNAQATLMESLPARRHDFARLNVDLKPDVLVLVEIAGQPEAEFIAKSLGWENYHAVMSDFDKVRDSAYTGLKWL